MNIGIPNEIASEERRVALTPVGVYALTSEGNTVYVEKGAGESCGFSDQDYIEVGAELVFTPEEAFHRADIVVKVEPLTEEETQYFDSEKTLLSFLNLGMSRKPIVENLANKEVTAIGFELIEQADGYFPVLAAISEMVGLLLPQIAGRLLECESGGRGIMLSGVSGIPGASVIILGAGTVGRYASRAFSELGAQVYVLDRNIENLRRLNEFLKKPVTTSIVTPLVIERALRFADVLIGAVMVHGKRTPHLVSEELVSGMKPGSVIIDVSIDQGGCIETSHPTTLSAQTYVQHGVIHYCVPNITATVARTASHAINNAVLPGLLQISRLGLTQALTKYPCLQKGIYLYNGQSTLKAISELFDIEFKDIRTLVEDI